MIEFSIRGGSVTDEDYFEYVAANPKNPDYDVLFYGANYLDDWGMSSDVSDALQLTTLRKNDKHVVIGGKWKDGLDISHFSMNNTFGLHKIIFNKPTPKFVTLGYLFAGTDLIEVCGLNNIVTSNVTDINGMFAQCYSLTSIGGLSTCDVSMVTDMHNMFDYCESLCNINMNGWDVSNVTNMSDMFHKCSSLTTLDLSSFVTCNVTNVEGMFAYSSALTTLDLSNFDMSNVTTSKDMFYDCSKLTQVDVSNCSSDTINKLKTQLETDCGGLWNHYNGILMKGYA